MKTKRASDVTPAVKNFVKGLDQFTQMDIKKANIKYISDLIEEFEEGEIDLVNESKEIFQESEMRVLVRRNEMTEGYFSADQLNRLAKAYSVMKDRTISVSNAKKLGDMINRLPDHALNDVRKKKIPFISGLALSRMIQRKIPVTESTYEYKEDLQEARWEIEGRLSYRGISSEDSFHMVIDAPTESAAEAKVEKELDKARARRKIGPGGGGSVEDFDIEGIERTTDKLSPPETFRGLNSYNPALKEADLSKSQIKKVHKQADDLPKKDFMKRYGNDGDSVRYATATNMVKKKLGLGESNFIKKGELKMNETYKQRLTSAMEHFNISSLGELNEDDHKTFFSYVDDMKEGLSAAQKKLPPALQKAIAAKMKDKKEMHGMSKAKKEVKEDLVGGQKKLDKDKDGDLDAKDFAMLRKSKGSMKKEYGSMMAMKKMKKEEALGQEPIKKMDSKGTEGGAKKDADMSKVKDAPKAKEGMKAVSGTKQVSENKRYLQTKPGSLEEAVLKTRGLVK